MADKSKVAEFSVNVNVLLKKSLHSTSQEAASIAANLSSCVNLKVVHLYSRSVTADSLKELSGSSKYG
jgi:hypothetical protein